MPDSAGATTTVGCDSNGTESIGMNDMSEGTQYTVTGSHINGTVDVEADVPAE